MMNEALLTNTLVREFQRCHEAFFRYDGLHARLLSGNSEPGVAIAAYNAYSDFISHLYEFYLGCIKRDGRFGRNVQGKTVDAILNAEVTKLLKIRRERILRGDAPLYENHISHYEVEVPTEFGAAFRKVRNIRSHAAAERSEFNLANFHAMYHRFIYLLFEEPQWIWNIEKVPDHDWRAIGAFAKMIVPKHH